jgi:ppGpp synthetase/RelA/SpoT-type nucleotidyltranferase
VVGAVGNGNVQGALERFREERLVLEQIADLLRGQLVDLIRSAGIDGTVTARAKDERSFAIKAFRKGYSDPWQQITDKVGGRVVVALPSDVDVVASLVREVLIGAEVEDKRIHPPDTLGYSGVHVTGVLPTSGIPDDLSLVEVQVRTIVQDAWSVVSHRLLYKPLVGLPVSEQRRMMRLAALAEIFDEEVGRVITALEAQPGFDLTPLVLMAEASAFDVGIVGGDRATTLTVLAVVRPTLPDNLDAYQATLEAFVSEQADRIKHLVALRGGGTDAGSLWENMLVGQPEAVVILERLHTRPMELLAVWAEADFPHALLGPFMQLLGVPDP